MPDRDRADLRPARESSRWIVVVLVIAALVAGAFWWYWQQQQSAPPVESAAPAMTAPPDGEPPAEPPVPSAAAGPQYPLETPAEAEPPTAADADAQVRSALAELLGGRGMAFLNVDEFVQRVVATVDNLPREHAAARLWPVAPTPPRFVVDGAGDAQVIGADNAARYTPFVLFVESVNVQRAVALYTKLYPLFQQAYEELGYPGRYFNDRLVAVIDHLLQAPEPAEPPQVRLVEVRGEVPSQRPWVRYEFADPQLERLTAGQKMMVRVGPVNERRLKTRLAELRRQITMGAVAANKRE